MAKPQKENGYTPIANELYDAIIRWPLSSYERKVLDVVIRKTYGWNKKEDHIALSQFAEAIGIKISHVSRSLSLLVKQNIVTKGGKQKITKYSVQKDYDKWLELKPGAKSHHKLVTKGGKQRKVTKGGKVTTKKGGDTKDNTITISKYSKDNPQASQSSADIVKVIDSFEPVNKGFKRWYGNTTQRKAITFLIEAYGLELVLKVIAILPQTNRKDYIPTVTTPDQLERKWASLEAALIKEKAKKAGNKPNYVL